MERGGASPAAAAVVSVRGKREGGARGENERGGPRARVAAAAAAAEPLGLLRREPGAGVGTSRRGREGDRRTGDQPCGTGFGAQEASAGRGVEPFQRLSREQRPLLDLRGAVAGRAGSSASSTGGRVTLAPRRESWGVVGCR